MIEYYSACVFIFHQAGHTALHDAAQENHVQICELLLNAGAEVDMRDKVSNCIGGHLKWFVCVCVCVFVTFI